jgi:choline dehydrogenase-like flavoprotein
MLSDLSRGEQFDAVIVGGGVCGATVAHKLSQAGKRVLLLEAGTSDLIDPGKYRSYLENYYVMGSLRGTPNGLYPVNPDALSPGTPSTDPYYVQKGPRNFMSDYLRMLGGSTLHWQGTSLRLVPNDFRMQTAYGQGVDWPISYDDLEPNYRDAEGIVGVSANVEDQTNLGVWFADGYVYPMSRLPQSVVDQFFAARLKDTSVGLYGGDYPLRVVSIPVGRNSTPNPAYDEGRGYQVLSAVGDRDAGNRCQGNSNCLPLCPVQAKYSSLKTINAAKLTGKLEIRSQCVASKLIVDSVSGRITGVEYKRYADQFQSHYHMENVTGTIIILAANAIQNAVLMLASDVTDESGQLGLNLMDHPYVGFYGLAPQPVYPFRGPDTTSGVESLRDGAFRKVHASFRASLANWGWSGEPLGSVSTLLSQKVFGLDFRQKLRDRMTRMVKLGVMFEQLPNPKNRVSIDKQQLDQLGNFRPILNYDYDSYTLDGVCAVMDKVWPAIARHAQIEDQTNFDAPLGGAQAIIYAGRKLNVMGSGHVVGTHRMGKDRMNSVVDSHSRCWAHTNLYAVGPGSMVTVGTANPTLTAVALSSRAADAILKDLR